MACRSIVLISQLNFSVAWRSENGGNDLTCNVLISGAHSHHSDKVDFEDEVFHGGPPHRDNTAPAEVVQQARLRRPAPWNEWPLKWGARRADPVVLPHPGGLGQALSPTRQNMGARNVGPQAMTRLQWPGVSPRCDECDKLPDMSESCGQRTRV